MAWGRCCALPEFSRLKSYVGRTFYKATGRIRTGEVELRGEMPEHFGGTFWCSVFVLSAENRRAKELKKAAIAARLLARREDSHDDELLWGPI